MYYKSILSKIAGIALILFLAGCNKEDDNSNAKSEDTGIALESIIVSPASVALTMILDETVQLTATAVPEDATNADFSWVSANDMVATVSSTGLVTARRVGQTKITVLCGRIKKDVRVVVGVPDTDLTGFTFDPPLLSATFGDTAVKFDIIKEPVYAKVVEFRFSSSNPNVATVGADSTVTFVGVGDAEIIIVGIGDAGEVERRLPVTVAENIPGLFGPHTLTSAGLTIPIINFDRGGEGVGYHDNDPENRTGNNYRGVNGDHNCGVDIEGSIDNPNICYTATGEWLNYTLNVQDAGKYFVSISMSSDAESGKFHLEADGEPFTGTINVPKNGGWSNWRWQDGGIVYLSAGTHVIRYAIDGNDHNLKEIRFEWRD